MGFKQRLYDLKVKVQARKEEYEQKRYNKDLDKIKQNEIRSKLMEQKELRDIKKREAKEIRREEYKQSKAYKTASAIGTGVMFVSKKISSTKKEPRKYTGDRKTARGIYSKAPLKKENDYKYNSKIWN